MPDAYVDRPDYHASKTERWEELVREKLERDREKAKYDASSG